MPPVRFLRSTTARLALIYLALFGASVMVLLGFLYWSTAGFMSRQTDATIDAEITGLAEQYGQFGTVGLVRAIERRTADARASRGLYLVTGPGGLTPIAGNLSQWPAEAPDAEGWLTFTLEYASPSARTGGGDVDLGRARVFALAGGLRLLVGRDIRERLEIAGRIRQSLAWGMAITIALAALGGIFISRSMLRRIEAINKTSRDIMAGSLSQRVPVRGSGDEFDRLAETMWEVIVQNSLMWKYKLEHPPLIPRYGFAQWADLSDGFIETSSLQHGMNCRFVQFSGNRDIGPQPFNVVIGVNEFEEQFMFQYSPDLQFRWMHPGMPKPKNPV